VPTEVRETAAIDPGVNTATSLVPSPAAFPLVAASGPPRPLRSEPPRQRPSPEPERPAPYDGPTVAPSALPTLGSPSTAVSPAPRAVASPPPPTAPSPVPVPPTTLAAVAAATPAPATPAPVPEPVARRFVATPTVVLGGAREAARGKLEFEVRPQRAEPGAAFVVEVYLTNDGDRTLKVEGLDLVTTANGLRHGGPGTPL